MWLKIQLTTVFVLALFFIVLPFFRISEKDEKQYQELLKSSSPTKKGGIISYTEQTREKVKKEIWMRSEQPLHIFIESAHSNLFLFHETHQIEAVEQLERVTCVMQEELYYQLADGQEAVLKENGRLLIRGKDPKNSDSWRTLTEDCVKMQTIRYMEAEKACFNYNTQLFLAQDATLKRYKIQGHEPHHCFEGMTPILTGKAKSVEFTLKDKKPDFQAHHLQATFNTKEKLL